MKISEQWLREWVSLKLGTSDLTRRLTMAGLEVTGVVPVAPDLKGVVVGEIMAVTPHPSAEHLNCCRVKIGKKKIIAVVCGAPNAVIGMKAPVARPGAQLPGKRTVEETEIRGVLSQGMLCSAEELGLEDSSAALMQLDEDARPGEPLIEHLRLDDAAIEIDLTPNRGDCLSVAGIARELAAITGAPLRQPRIKPVRATSRRKFPLSVSAPADCPRYVGRVIENIDPHAVTPIWMKERLRRSGVRSIHPVVDVTNYVMLELGQPMHAFDLEKLTGRIDVRIAEDGEELSLLDGSHRRVEKGTLLIADDRKPLAIAGIMGGLESAVTVDTRQLFLESAYFRPGAIGSRARNLGLQTESSQRFERGVDPMLQERAIERATRLLLDIAGGQPGPVVEQVAKRHLPHSRPIRLRPGRIERILGMSLPATEVGRILRRLGMRVSKGRQDWRVTPPSYRFDVAREEDLIEELVRIHGYEAVPTARPRIEMMAQPIPENLVSEARLRTLLVDRDYQEIVTYSFVDPNLQMLIDPAVRPVQLANPIATDMSVMRTSLWPGLLQALLHNQNRQQTRVRVFEIGRRFVRNEKGGGFVQDKMLAGAVCGAAYAEQWGMDERPVDFYDAKADIEAVLAVTGRPSDFRFVPQEHPALHPRRSAAIVDREQRIGWLGALHPAVQARIGVDRETVLFELSLAHIREGRVPIFKEISRFPAIRRDIAVVVPEEILAQAVLDCTAKVAGNLLVKLELFDEYRGEGIDSGRKSIALGLTLQDSSRTLKEMEVEAVLAQVLSSLASELGAQLRR